MTFSFKKQDILDVIVEVLEVEKNDGILTKKIRLNAKGELIKDASYCNLSEGLATSKRIPLKELSTYFRSLSHNKAIIHGVTSGDKLTILSCKKYSDEQGTITRTKNFIKYSNGPGLAMFDYDLGPGSKVLSKQDFITLISSIFPEFAEAATLWTPSTSACIYDQGGREIQGIGNGFHLYFAAKKASDLPRFADVLFKRCWLAGYGYIVITKSGAQLLRTIFDKTVFSPERLDFVAGAVCEDGLEQHLPMPEYTAGGYLDTTLLPDLTPEEERQYQEMVEEARRKTTGEAEVRKAEYVQSETDKLVAKGIDLQQAERIVTQRIGGDLLPGDILYFDDFGAVDVADVLKNPEKFDQCTLRDPLEPEYGGGHRKAMFFANLENDKPVVHSFAHGGRDFFLHKDPAIQTIAVIKRALEKAKVDPGAPYEKDVLEALHVTSESTPADYMRFREKFKKANKSISVTRLDKLVESCAQEQTDSNKADDLVALIEGLVELFHNPDQECFATFERDGHRETYPIESKGFVDWVGYVIFKRLGRVVGDATIKMVLNGLSGLAKYAGRERQTFLRAAKYENGYIIDLCNEDWEVVHITADGWEILKESPVKFWRSNTMQPLPKPKKNGDISLLWKHVNIHEEDRPFLVALILEAFRPDTPFPIGEFIGGQGTSKSTSMNNIRDLVDPNTVNLRAAPKSVEDVYVGAGNNWVVSYDNLSNLTPQMQDALCCLATGGGHAARKLYTDMDEKVTNIKRAVMMNGIIQLSTRQDLIDRVIHFVLEEITFYRQESELKEAFNKHRPSIFGGILDLFSDTLKKLTEINIENPPRMADFAKLGEAVSQVMGEEPGTFLSRYDEKRRQTIVEALDCSPVAVAVQKFMDGNPEGFQGGFVNDLFELVKKYNQGGNGWPNDSSNFSKELRKQQPGLKAVGIKVTFPKRTKKGQPISITRIPFFSKKNSFQKRPTLLTPLHPTPLNKTPDNQKGVGGVRSASEIEKSFSPKKKNTSLFDNTPDQMRI